jgi:hypothetical protein
LNFFGNKEIVKLAQIIKRLFRLTGGTSSENSVTKTFHIAITGKKGHARTFSSELIHILLLTIANVSNVLRNSL